MPDFLPRRPPLVVRALFRALLPIAERDEVLSELTAEFRRRIVAHGEAAARRWAWRQALGSAPALLRRGWWRGMTGFEPHANRLRPGGPMFESWIMDIRYAVRRLMSRPLYAALAVATLALGAGGTAAVYSVTERLLLDPLPIAREEQVGVLWFGGSWNEQEFLRLRPNFPGFERMARVSARRPDARVRRPAAAADSRHRRFLGAVRRPRHAADAGAERSGRARIWSAQRWSLCSATRCGRNSAAIRTSSASRCNSAASRGPSSA